MLLLYECIVHACMHAYLCIFYRMQCKSLRSCKLHVQDGLKVSEGEVGP